MSYPCPIHVFVTNTRIITGYAATVESVLSIETFQERQLCVHFRKTSRVKGNINNFESETQNQVYKMETSS